MRRCSICLEEVNTQDPMKNGRCVACNEDDDFVKHCTGAYDDEE